MRWWKPGPVDRVGTVRILIDDVYSGEDATTPKAPARLDGIVDFPALRDLLIELDYDGFAMVEQDMYPTPFDKPLPIATRSRDYYASIDFGMYYISP